MTTQDNWRWCHECQGMYFAGNPGSKCPAGGGHDHQGSGNYILTQGSGSGQDNWRWCNRCQGLFFAGNFTTGFCPPGGGHNYKGSGNYFLIL